MSDATYPADAPDGCPQGCLCPAHRAENDAARLSRLLWEARELLDMYFDTVKGMTGKEDPWIKSTRAEIDAYRAERGWSPNGFGGEVIPPAWEDADAAE